MDKKDKEENFIKENSIIFKKYRVKKKLAEGAFGDVYMGSCIENNELVAIKVEPRKIQKPLLETEAFFLYSLRGVGIPEVLSFGRLKNYLVLYLYELYFLNVPIVYALLLVLLLNKYLLKLIFFFFH